MHRPVFLTRIASNQLKAVGESMILLTTLALALLLMLVWIRVLFSGLGWVDATLKAWLS